MCTSSTLQLCSVKMQSRCRQDTHKQHNNALLLLSRCCVYTIYAIMCADVVTNAIADYESTHAGVFVMQLLRHGLLAVT